MVLDGNSSPLGKDLTFEIEVVGIKWTGPTRTCAVQESKDIRAPGA